MIIAAINTSSSSLSISVLENKKTITKRYINGKDFHSEKILSCTRNTINDAGINFENVDLFAACSGPGSFTGIRVGFSFVKGMAFMLNKPCVGISSLLALAYPFMCLKDEIIYSCIYANMDEFYFNSYVNAGKGNKKVSKNKIDSFVEISEIKEKVKNEKKRIIFVGNMAKVCYDMAGLVCSNTCKFYDRDVDSDYIGQAAYDEYSSGNYLNKKLEANYVKGSRAEKIWGGI
jgi:tRNA threonylcarbamoyladenosine biosynthesis protein TsaB